MPIRTEHERADSTGFIECLPLTLALTPALALNQTDTGKIGSKIKIKSKTYLGVRLSYRSVSCNRAFLSA